MAISPERVVSDIDSLWGLGEILGRAYSALLLRKFLICRQGVEAIFSPPSLIARGPLEGSEHNAAFGYNRAQSLFPDGNTLEDHYV